eukprot:2659048-Prymnesium_polylepis.1
MARAAACSSLVMSAQVLSLASMSSTTSAPSTSPTGGSSSRSSSTLLTAAITTALDADETVATASRTWIASGRVILYRFSLLASIVVGGGGDACWVLRSFVSVGYVRAKGCTAEDHTSGRARQRPRGRAFEHSFKDTRFVRRLDLCVVTHLPPVWRIGRPRRRTWPCLRAVAVAPRFLRDAGPSGPGSEEVRPYAVALSALRAVSLHTSRGLRISVALCGLPCTPHRQSPTLTPP